MEATFSSRLSLPIPGAVEVPPSFSDVIEVPSGDVLMKLHVMVIGSTGSSPGSLTVSVQISDDRVDWAEVADGTITFAGEALIGAQSKILGGLEARHVRLACTPGYDPKDQGAVAVLVAKLVICPP